MRRLLGWLAGAAGGLAAYRFLRRRHTAPVEAPPGPDDRAEELRAKLAETQEEPAPEPEAPAAEESPEERRRRVHDHGRAALDEMRHDE